MQCLDPNSKKARKRVAIELPSGEDLGEGWSSSKKWARERKITFSKQKKTFVLKKSQPTPCKRSLALAGVMVSTFVPYYHYPPLRPLRLSASHTYVTGYIEAPMGPSSTSINIPASAIDHSGWRSDMAIIGKRDNNHLFDHLSSSVFYSFNKGKLL